MDKKENAGLVFEIWMEDGSLDDMCKNTTIAEAKVVVMKYINKIVSELKSVVEKNHLIVSDFFIGIDNVMANENEFFDRFFKKSKEEWFSKNLIIFIKLDEPLSSQEADETYLKISESEIQELTGYSIMLANCQIVNQSYYKGEYDSGWFSDGPDDSYLVDGSNKLLAGFFESLKEKLIVPEGKDVCLIDISGIEGKPEKLVISALVTEKEKEEGIIYSGKKKIDGYAIWENKAGYDFIYYLTQNESANNALRDLKIGKMKNYDDAENGGADGQGVEYYDELRNAIRNVSEFEGAGDTEVVDISFPYGFSSVTLKLDTGEEFTVECSDYESLAEDEIGKKIIELLKAVFKSE